MVRKQIIQQRSEVASANAITEQARGQLLEAQANRQDLVVRAPFNGVVVTRAAEPGEVVIAGTALLTMVDLTKVYCGGSFRKGKLARSNSDNRCTYIWIPTRSSLSMHGWRVLIRRPRSRLRTPTSKTNELPRCLASGFS